MIILQTSMPPGTSRPTAHLVAETPDIGGRQLCVKPRHVHQVAFVPYGLSREADGVSHGRGNRDHRPDKRESQNSNADLGGLSFSLHRTVACSQRVSEAVDIAQRAHGAGAGRPLAKGRKRERSLWRQKNAGGVRRLSGGEETAQVACARRAAGQRPSRGPLSGLARSPGGVPVPPHT